MPRSKGTALLQGTLKPAVSFPIAILFTMTDANDYFLSLGTGGVSMFGLMICLGAGIRPIITSSSDRKIDLAQKVGGQDAIDAINYRTHPKWEEEVLRLTNGRGVDVVIDNVGPTSMAQSLASLARRGIVSLVGFLGGFEMDRFPDTITPLLMKSATIRYYTLFARTNSCRSANSIYLGESLLVPRLTTRTCATFCQRRRLA